MKNNEFTFISDLFQDNYISVLFKDNTISFITDDDDEHGILIIEYPGNMRKFLTKLAALNIPDNTFLVNIPRIAKNALNFIK